MQWIRLRGLYPQSYGAILDLYKYNPSMTYVRILNPHRYDHFYITVVYNYHIEPYEPTEEEKILYLSTLIEGD